MKFLLKLVLMFILPVIVFIFLLNYNILYAFLFVFGIFIVLLVVFKAWVFEYISRFNYAKGDMEKTIVWMKRAFISDKYKPKYGVMYAYILLKMGKIEESEVIFNQLLKYKLNEEDKGLVKSNYALLLWKKGKIDEALETLNEIFTTYRTTNIYGSIGFMFVLKGDLDKALEFNLEAYDYNNSNPVIMDNLGQTYLLRGELEKAEEIYNKLLALNPKFPEPYFNYGLLLAEKNEYEKAIEFAKKALDFQITFLSSISKVQIEEKILELENHMSV